MTKVIARTIIELMGAPKEHIENTIVEYVERIETEKERISVKKKFISDAEEKEDGKMWSIFAELDIECEDISELMWFCFDYMPASVEIIEPNEIVYDSKDFTEFLNDLQEKLHKTDGLVKTLRAKNNVLGKNSVMLMKNLVRLSLKDEKKTLKELSTTSGVPEKDLEKFLIVLEKEGRIKKENTKYLLIK